MMQQGALGMMPAQTVGTGVPNAEGNNVTKSIIASTIDVIFFIKIPPC